jgi:hypothetical protein
MPEKPTEVPSEYENTKAGRRLREQGREKVEEHAKKYREFARGEKRQGDGV